MGMWRSFSTLDFMKPKKLSILLIACLQPERNAELAAVGNELRVSEASS
jgi:hypothetical protein